MSTIRRAVFRDHLLQGMRRACAAGCAILLLLGAALASERPKVPPAAWAPPDIDAVFPPVRAESPCALGPVLKNASQRVEDLVVNMQRFSAAEQFTFEEMDRHGGGVRTSKTASFSYVAYIHEVTAHQLAVEEYRNDLTSPDDFPSKVATLGTAAFALLFHPNYLRDFAVTCEGLSEWQGRRAWRLHLAQTKANNFRGYRLANRYFRVMLKARAWIDAETFEVLRLETDLQDPIGEIPLLLEHVIVDYAMVDFPRRKLQLWLPREAEIYMDYRGHQYHQRHSFSQFKLFWVDTEQTVKEPQVAASEPSYLPPNIDRPVAEPANPRASEVSEPQPTESAHGAAFQPAIEAKTVIPPPVAASVGAPPPPVPAVTSPATLQIAASIRAPFKPAVPASALSPQPPAAPGSAPPLARESGPTVPPKPAVPEPAKAAVTPTVQEQTSGPQPPATTASAPPVPEPEVTTPLNLKPRQDSAPDSTSKAQSARPQDECPECLRVLISQKDGERGMLRDNWRSQAQDDWIKRKSEHLLKGKGAKISVVHSREDAEYNIVWSAGLVQGTPYTTMRAEAVVFEIGSGQKLFSVSYESRYWDVDHPENKCLQDAISFLKNKSKSPHGYGLAFR